MTDEHWNTEKSAPNKERKRKNHEDSQLCIICHREFESRSIDKNLLFSTFIAWRVNSTVFRLLVSGSWTMLRSEMTTITDSECSSMFYLPRKKHWLIRLLPKPVGSMAETSFSSKRDLIASFCSGFRVPRESALKLPRNLLFQLERFSSRTLYVIAYTQENLIDLLTDWQVIIQSVFPVSQKREFE